MTYFFDPAARTPKELLPGVSARTFWGDRTLLAVVDLSPHAIIPGHSHPHEQVGIVIQGEMELTIGDERRVVKLGDVYVIPGGVVHSVRLGEASCQVAETFTPVREEYKFPD